METVRHSPNWSHMTMQWNGSLHNMVYAMVWWWAVQSATKMNEAVLVAEHFRYEISFWQ